MAYAIDTLAGAKDLERAGVPDEQAEAIVHLITQQGEGLATKTDITALQSEMATKTDIAVLDGRITALQSEMATKTDIAVLDGRITALQSEMATKTDLAEMKVTLLQAMFGVMGLVIATVVAVNKLF